MPVAERHRRELQRQVPGRMSKSGVVSEQDRCEDRDRGLAASLQRGSTSLELGKSDTGRVQAEHFINETGVRPPSLKWDEESHQVTPTSSSRMTMPGARSKGAGSITTCIGRTVRWVT